MLVISGPFVKHQSLGAHFDIAPKFTEAGSCRGAPFPGRSDVEASGTLEFLNRVRTTALAAAETAGLRGCEAPENYAPPARRCSNKASDSIP
jgi:hypothetical protein